MVAEDSETARGAPAFPDIVPSDVVDDNASVSGPVLSCQYNMQTANESAMSCQSLDG